MASGCTLCSVQQTVPLHARVWQSLGVQWSLAASGYTLAQSAAVLQQTLAHSIVCCQLPMLHSVIYHCTINLFQWGLYNWGSSYLLCSLPYPSSPSLASKHTLPFLYYFCSQMFQCPTTCLCCHPHHHQVLFYFYKTSHSTPIGVWVASNSQFDATGWHKMMTLDDGTPM